MESGKENEIKIMKKGVELDGEEGGETGEPQWQTIKQKYSKYGLRKKEKNMKEGKYTRKIRKSDGTR